MAAVPLDSDLFAIAILIDELKHTEISCRLNSMRKLAQLGARGRAPMQTVFPLHTLTPFALPPHTTDWRASSQLLPWALSARAWSWCPT